jgi:hypothetical protein
MKLNLLPSHVSKEGQAKTAVFASAALALLGIGAAVGMTLYGKQQLDAAKAEADFWRPKADQALATSKQADDIMAKSVYIDRNLKLAKAMAAHNEVYPDLYDEVLRYLPRWFRVSGISARSVNETTSVVQVTGVLQTVQQYSDVMLALLQIPGATNVSRTGFVDGRMVVPGLSTNDQLGTPVAPGEPPLPSDPFDRLQERIVRAEGAPRGFLDVGGYGRPEVDERGPMPGWSQVGLAVTIQRNIQTPNPRATLTAQGAAAAPAAAPAAAGAAAQPPAGGNPRGGERAARGGQDDDE